MWAIHPRRFAGYLHSMQHTGLVASLWSYSRAIPGRGISVPSTSLRREHLHYQNRARFAATLEASAIERNAFPLLEARIAVHTPLSRFYLRPHASVSVGGDMSCADADFIIVVPLLVIR